MKVRFYDIRTLEASREVLLARPDPPVSVRFHPHIKDTILILYAGDPSLELLGELRAINTHSGQSYTLVTQLQLPLSMVVSPHRQELGILSSDGMVRLYGVSEKGQITYERFVLTSGLRIFDESIEGLMDTKSNFSQRNLNLILNLLKSNAKKKLSTAARALAYDPLDNDLYVVTWEFNIQALFSSKTGECLRIFEPRGAANALAFAGRSPGVFWSAGANGVLSVWSVGQSKPLREIKISNNAIVRLFSMENQFLAGTMTGQFMVIDHNGKIIYQQEDFHGQAVLELFKCNSGDILTCSADGCAHMSRIRSGKLRIELSYLHKETIIDKDVIQQVQLKNKNAAVSVVSTGDLVIIGYANGLILAYTHNGRPVGTIFTQQDMERTFERDILRYIVQAESDQSIKQVVRPSYQLTELKSMYYSGQFLYTGWLDGAVRIFQIKQFQSEQIGVYINAIYCGYFNVPDTIGISGDCFISVNKILPDKDMLYVCCSCGLFLVFNIGQFRERVLADNIQEKNMKVQKQYRQYLVKQYFCTTLHPSLKELQTVTNQHIDAQMTYYNTRILTDVEVYAPSQTELDYIANNHGIKNVDKILYVVDNIGFLMVLGQIGTSVQDMKFVVLKRYFHEFQSYNRKNTDANIGITRVRKLQEPFSCVFAGAEGLMCLLYWDSSKRYYLESSKSDFSSLEVEDKFIVAGCVDGCVKLI